MSGTIPQHTYRRCHDPPQKKIKKIGALFLVHPKLVCAELARTDQQGYAACLVQWLLSNEETTAQEYDSSARVGEGVSEGMEESADVDGCDFGSINSDELEFDPGLPSCFA